MSGTTKVPLSHRTCTLPLDDAVAAATSWWAAHHLVPDGADRQLRTDVTLVLAAAASAGLRTLQDLLDHAGRVITAVTGVDNLSRFCAAEDSHHTHRVRNAIGALGAGAAMAGGDDPATAIAALPNLRLRAGGRHRPLHCDEIILLRHVALHAALAGGRRHTVAIRYALVESGARPSETTVISPADFDDPRRPSTVTLPGVRTRAAERTVPLDAWAIAVLRPALDARLARNAAAATQPVAYNGNAQAGGHTASATASSTLARLMGDAGLDAGSLDPTGVVRWRVLRVVERDGLRAAKDVAGATSFDHLTNFLNAPLPAQAAPPVRRGFL